MVVIGLVGAIAGGKSTVARALAERGAAWIDSDRLAHRVLRLAAVRRELARYFGPQVISADGQIDRQAVAERVFGDDEASGVALRYLQSVVHPPTRQLALRRLVRAARRPSPAALLDTPLLLEAGWDLLCDVVWCVDAPQAVRLERVAARGWTLDQLRARERRQLAMSEKYRRSTERIVNDGDLRTLHRTLDRMWNVVTAGPPVRGGWEEAMHRQTQRHCDGSSLGRGAAWS